MIDRLVGFQDFEPAQSGYRGSLTRAAPGFGRPKGRVNVTGLVDPAA